MALCRVTSVSRTIPLYSISTGKVVNRWQLGLLSGKVCLTRIVEEKDLKDLYRDCSRKKIFFDQNGHKDMSRSVFCNVKVVTCLYVISHSEQNVHVTYLYNGNCHGELLKMDEFSEFVSPEDVIYDERRYSRLS